MDAFSALLDDGGFKMISFDGYNLSHLLYADDVLVFGEASIDNCTNLSRILNTFANAIGLHVNFDNSSVMLPKNLKNQEAICQALSIHNISHKITYLGIHLSFYSLKVADFMPLMDSISKKLSGWNAHLFSFVGQLQFLKFTILNSIAYLICRSIIPKYVLKFFKRASSKFLLFGDLVSKNKIHMISYDRICKPKFCGDLGIPSLAALHFVFNCSVISIMYNRGSPLSSWLIHRYYSPWRPTPNYASKFWKVVCKTAIVAKPFFNFRITASAPISLHWDH
ncbi:hypothetical protein KFK09_002917 [Dendrobium nobile]|uniref:Reverse transcriptase domain-containing protein n=1 Tax=Dendrobium nobile TaxID=94219 RepID=A0A8T3C506_DENNO|nr:hypothetical protein KFK09_002917 [Dendrobium nobile]